MVKHFALLPVAPSLTPSSFHELLELLAKVNWRPTLDQVILAGDMVGKGPDVRSVVRFARQNNFRAVKGNFEVAWLYWREDPDRRRLPGTDAVQAKSLEAEDWDWLAALPLFIRLPAFNAAVVHAGCVPGVPLERQEAHVLTHIRCLTPDGRVRCCLSCRAAHALQPSEAFIGTERLWAKHWSGPETIIFGHDAVRGVQQERLALGLDTGACYGGQLTAVELPSRTLTSVKARRVWSEPKSKM